MTNDDAPGKKPSAGQFDTDADRFTPIDDILEVEGRETLPTVGPKTASKVAQANSILEEHQRWAQIEARVRELVDAELRPLRERLELQEGALRRLRNAFIKWFSNTRQTIDFTRMTLPEKVQRMLFYMRELRRQAKDFVEATRSTQVDDDPQGRG